MDSFLFIGDYAKQIQSENLNQIIGNNTSILEAAQLAAVEECRSYLSQKYYLAQGLRPISQYNPTVTYTAGQTVYLSALPYASQSYGIGTLTLQDGNIYVCSTTIDAPQDFTPANWTLLGAQYQIFHCQFPHPVFDADQVYHVGDSVFWRNKTYTNLVATIYLSANALLQINEAGTNPVVNVFPDDSNAGAKSWGIGNLYTIPAGSLSNPNYFTPGDNRDQKLLMICIDICLYHLHCRIAPKSVPDSRVVRYMGNQADRETRGQRVLYPTYSALGWLQAASIGDDITPSLPVIQRNQTKQIRFGGNQKNINSY
jgi:hypothetical protein